MFRWALRKGIDKVERERIDDASHECHANDAGRSLAGMVLRVTEPLTVTLMVTGFLVAAPAAAYASVESAPSVYTITAGRIGAIVAAVVGLIGASIGGLALARAGSHTGGGTGRRGAIVALVLGPIGLVLGGLVVATADGGLGTGNGLGGGIVAMMVGLIGMTLGALALARSRRTV
jgi:hypothetical protein